MQKWLYGNICDYIQANSKGSKAIKLIMRIFFFYIFTAIFVVLVKWWKSSVMTHKTYLPTTIFQFYWMIDQPEWSDKYSMSYFVRTSNKNINKCSGFDQCVFFIWIHLTQVFVAQLCSAWVTSTLQPPLNHFSIISENKILIHK